MRKLMTQKRAVFYILWKQHRIDRTKYTPAWKFIGELEIPELKETFFMSYKTPANGIDIFFENPELIERRETVGKSGTKFYEYRIVEHPSVEKIMDESLFKFYRLIKKS